MRIYNSSGRDERWVRLCIHRGIIVHYFYPIVRAGSVFDCKNYGVAGSGTAFFFFIRPEKSAFSAFAAPALSLSFVENT